MTAYYEQQPGESAEAAAERTGAAPDVAPRGPGRSSTIPRGYLRKNIQHLAGHPEPVSWLFDPEAELEARQ